MFAGGYRKASHWISTDEADAIVVFTSSCALRVGHVEERRRR